MINIKQIIGRLIFDSKKEKARKVSIFSALQSFYDFYRDDQGANTLK
jgi:hypothetical protein